MTETQAPPCFYQRLLDDHRQTEQALSELDAMLRDEPPWGRFKTTVDSLVLALRVHFACEEHGLFPVLSQYRTMMLMDVEHDNLLSAQEAFLAELDVSIAENQTTPNLLPAYQQWRSMLKAHIDEEESGVFPQADALFEPEEKVMVARKLAEEFEHYSHPMVAETLLNRPEPQYSRKGTGILTAPAKPISYDKLFEAHHASLYHIQLAAGQRLKTHMSGEVQALLVVSGSLRFQHQDQTVTVSAGEMLTLEPRLPYSLEALTDSSLLAFKVWPKPHFLRV